MPTHPRGDLGLAGSAFHILGRLTLAGDYYIVASISDRLPDGSQADDARQVLDARPLGGKIDADRDNAVQPGQHALYGKGTVGAGHARHRQFDSGRRHIIADVTDEGKKVPFTDNCWVVC
jgi:hypothetical protein